MTDLRIRAATAADLDTVLAFWKVAAEGTSISDDRDGVERLVVRDPEALILAERDGELVGTVIAGFDGWRCHLYRLAGHPHARRPGGARMLLGAAGGRLTPCGGRGGGGVPPRGGGGGPTGGCGSATRPPTTPGGPRVTRRSRTGGAGRS